MSYSAGRLDYNKAKIAAYVVVAGFLALLFVYGVRTSGGPELFPGDKVESLTCPLCQGSGDGKQAGTRCQACLGNKLLKAVVPGPQHPAEVRGTVRDLAAFPSVAEAESAAARDAANTKPSLTAVQGGLANAKLVFEGPPGRTEFESKSTGKFWGMVPPGQYKLTVSADGFASQTREFTVAPRQQPIWPEAGGLDSSLREVQQLDLFLSRP